MGAAFNPNPVIDWTPSDAQVGVNTFTARVVDAAGHSDSKTFHVTVTSANRPPHLEAQPNEQVATGGAFARVLNASDPDPVDTLTFSLVAGPVGMTLAGNQLSWSPATMTPGTYAVTVKVTDAGGLFDSAQFTLSVFAVTAPVAADDAYEVALGQTLNVPAAGVLVNDVDSAGATLSAVLASSPDKGNLSSLNPDGSFTYFAPAAPQGPVLDVKRVLEWASGVGVEVGISPPLVADVTGDGKPEILSFEFNGDMHVIRGDTGALVFHVSALPPAQIGGMSCFTYGIGQGTYAAADIDDDGQVEIVLPAQCAGDAGQFFVGGAADRAVAIVYDPLQPEGFRVKWLTPMLSDTTGPWMMSNTNFTIARLHGQDKPSVLIGKTFYGGGACAQVRAAFTDFACRVVFSLNGQDGSIGAVYYSTPPNVASVSGYNYGGVTSNGGFMGPLVADVDNDGSLDILYEGTLWDVNGTVKRQFDGSAGTGPATLSSALADLDGDAQMEIVTLDVYGGYGAGFLKAWKVDGRRLWTVAVPRTYVLTKITIADVDRDGRPEIIFGLYNGIWVFDSAGRVKWIRGMVVGQFEIC